MDNKKIKIALFLIIALLQLYVPAKMIWQKEAVIKTGIEYKFKAAPIDPTDPFRGKYIVLRYEANSFLTENGEDWRRGEEIYLKLVNDQAGYASISSVHKKKPLKDEDFLKVKIWHVTKDKLIFKYPFDRYYMEESKAYDAELAYRKTQRDSSQTTYALVSIKNGDSVLKDVLINGTSIREIVKERQGLDQ